METVLTTTLPESQEVAGETPVFVDRRNPDLQPAPGRERRQFANNHDDLSPEAAELAQAIDQYKLAQRRRFIT
ncbi:MAG: hypothetical protein AAF589_00525 [Planctomycetota bacterium]